MSGLASIQSLIHQIDPRVQGLSCSKELLERPTFSIVVFAAEFQKANEHLGQIIHRMVIDFFWINEIWRQYPADCPDKHRLIGQVVQQSRLPDHLSRRLKKLMIDRYSAHSMRYIGRSDSMPRPSG